MQAIQAIIFDFDGTLVDASAAIISSFNTVLTRNGRPPLSDTAVAAMIGKPLREMFASVFPSASSEDIEGYVDQYREVFIPISTSMTRPLPGLHEVVQSLSSCVKLGIATSRTVRGARHILEDIGLVGHFATIVGIEDVTNSKPHPQPIELALERLAARPEHAVMVGDTVDDIVAGRSAGTVTVGISNEPDRRSKLQEAGADHVIRRLRELVGVIGLSGNDSGEPIRA